MQNPKEFFIFLEKLKGKEQMIRFVQYSAFLVLALTNRTKYISLTRKAQKLSGNLSMVRKVLRFGMPITNILNIKNLFSLSGFKKKIFALLNNFLGLVFYFSDHHLYFYRIRLIKLEKGSKKLQTIDVIRNLA